MGSRCRREQSLEFHRCGVCHRPIVAWGSATSTRREARAFELLVGGRRRPSAILAAVGRVPATPSPFPAPPAGDPRARLSALQIRGRRSRAKRRCGAITYHANKPQHLNPCSWSSPEGAVGILSSGGNATQIVRRPSRAPPGARAIFCPIGTPQDRVRMSA